MGILSQARGKENFKKANNYQQLPAVVGERFV